MPVELLGESTLVARLVAAVNMSVTDTDGLLLGRMDETLLYTVLEEYRAVSSMSSMERGPIITKEILSKRRGIVGMNARRPIVHSRHRLRWAKYWCILLA
jgi:hypothetical protein